MPDSLVNTTARPVGVREIPLVLLAPRRLFARVQNVAVYGLPLIVLLALVTTEAGGEDSFSTVLNTRPTAQVSIGLSSDDITERNVSPAALLFSPLNWDTPQVVTVTGVDDAVLDGDVGYSIITAADVSTDLDYSGLNAADVFGVVGGVVPPAMRGFR